MQFDACNEYITHSVCPDASSSALSAVPGLVQTAWSMTLDRNNYITLSCIADTQNQLEILHGCQTCHYQDGCTVIAVGASPHGGSHVQIGH